ncbi:aldehyde dehydrogenase family protein [Streptomyces pathocidini]|uniref:aldehyde dehydrogenase family protein n=1 Tax=Streptomyces pathocidini TaxID=1650571 RepID=UPI0033DB9E92
MTRHSPALPHARHLIDGRWRDSATRTPSVNPATGRTLGTFADGGAPEAREAVAAAHRAFTSTGWPRDRRLRARALNELADQLAARRARFIELLARENGKTLTQAAFELDLAIPKLRYYAALALTDHGRALEAGPGLYAMTLREPAGVAGIITPWNSPVVLAVRALAPALAAGCTAVVKMPGQVGLTAGLFSETVASAASLPPGVVNTFTESGNEGAPWLVASPDVAAISYTGSTEVGRTIMERAAPTLKSLSLELGGKTPMIVFGDADLDAAVPVLTRAITTFAGQFCMAGSRVLAQRSIAGELRERLVNALSAVELGPGDDPATEMGPLIDAAAAQRVDEAVEEAVAASAEPLLRGERAGAFLGPSLLEVTEPTAAIVQREIFGPVATFELFEDEPEAIASANATPFGLAAAIWSRDADRPLRVARELKTGTVWTNTWAIVLDESEEGGYTPSGLGRLNGPGALHHFQETKTLIHHLNQT